MLKKDKILKTCRKGHSYYKSSDCPVCPICEAERKPKDDFLSLISAPARRALEAHGILSPEQLSKYRISDVLKFHGMGKSSIPKLQAALKSKGLSFKLEIDKT